MHCIRFIRLICLLCCVSYSSSQLHAQTGRPVIVVIAPVYLDSCFSGDTYLLGKNNLPRYIMPGLDFYNGMILAIDSLKKENSTVQFVFIDSKSSPELMEDPEDAPALQDASLIIASFNTRNEIEPLAAFAQKKKIPLISATYPNDAGITANPYFTLINPTLTAHIEAIHRFMRKTFPTETILYFRKNSAGDDMIQQLFSKQQTAGGGLPLRTKTIALPDSLTAEQVLGYLDSTKRNTIFCGSLDDRFAVALSNAIGSNRAYRTVMIGMPTWDGIRDMNRNVEYLYTSPYNLTRTDKVSIQITNTYRARFAGRPSDMVFKAFELVFRSAKLLQQYNSNWLQHMNGGEYKIFHDFNLQPVRSASGIDYTENKKLYFIRKADGKVRSVN
jgi:ABC-type branched-subunit amino acid transport system substrate-binding protein